MGDSAREEPAFSPPGSQLASHVVAIYPLPMLGTGFMIGILTLYLLKFATDVLLVAPASIGLILGISRAWDALFDPIVGY